jgi:hypothetical protein
MKPKEKLLEELIKSLNAHPEKWTFNEHTAQNSEWGISLWIANTPVLDLGVYKPTEVNFSLIKKIRLYRALNQSRAASILKLNGL